MKNINDCETQIIFVHIDYEKDTMACSIDDITSTINDIDRVCTVKKESLDTLRGRHLAYEEYRMRLFTLEPIVALDKEIRALEQEYGEQLVRKNSVGLFSDKQIEGFGFRARDIAERLIPMKKKTLCGLRASVCIRLVKSDARTMCETTSPSVIDDYHKASEAYLRLVYWNKKLFQSGFLRSFV